MLLIIIIIQVPSFNIQLFQFPNLQLFLIFFIILIISDLVYLQVYQLRPIQQIQVLLYINIIRHPQELKMGSHKMD